ncbi:hypothetical protein RhiirB3_447166 [Rhizophagus irregularis]|nr:hypothetical protein RhiirB3_447166 [Rhizophagus irregularis]
MACSKIFSDLPELTNEIIQHFRNDFSTLYSLDDDDFMEVEELVYKSLLEIFIKNEGKLHSLEYAISTLDSYCNDTMELILQNPNFTYNIKDLTLFLDDIKITINIVPFLKFFSSNYNSISSINFCYSSHIENFEYGYMGEEYEESRPLLLELIIKYCTKIKRFNSDKPDNFNVYLLIENIGQTINYISIDLDDQELSQIILQNLGRVLPSKLEYLHLELFFITADDFKMFLVDFQNTFVKKFLINDITRDLYEGILFYTKEYIMKKKRVKYLAIKVRRELAYLKYEVKEFRSYDIIVKRYFDLYINILDDIIYNFTK